MWGRISAAVSRVKRASSTIGSAGSRQIAAAAIVVKQAPDAVRKFRQSWVDKPKHLEFAIAPAELPDATQSTLRYYLIAIVGLSLAASLTAYIGGWIFRQFGDHRIAGILLSPVVAIVGCAAIYFVARELWSWRRLVIVDRIRTALSSCADVDECRVILRRLASALREPHRTSISELVDPTGDIITVTALRDSFDRQIVHQMDGYAIGVIHRAVRNMFFLSLVSPTDLIDTLAFAVRAASMIRGVAFAYGQRPGRLGLIRLVRHAVADVALLSVTMIVMARATKTIGGVVQSVTDRVGGLSSTVGVVHPGIGIAAEAVRTVGSVAGGASEVITDELVDAAVAAARMAQLGLIAVSVTRPIELSDDRRKAMRKDLRRMITHMRREAARSGRELQESVEKDEEVEKTGGN